MSIVNTIGKPYSIVDTNNSILQPPVGGVSAPVVQIVMNRLSPPKGKRQGTSSARTDVLNDNRMRMVTSKIAVTNLQFLMSGVVLNGGSPEANLGNDFAYQAGIEIVSPPATTLATFSGSNSPATVTNGSLLTSDAAGPLYSLTPPTNTAIYARTSITVATASLFFPQDYGNWFLGNGDELLASPSHPSQVSATSDLVVPGDGTGPGGAANGAVPCAIIGVAAANLISVGIMGDSIGRGEQDSFPGSTNSGFGYIARGMEGHATYGQIPYINFATSGNNFESDTAANGPSKRLLWKYLTHIILETGTNDIGANTFLQMKAYIDTAIAEIKSYNSAYGQAGGPSPGRKLKIIVCKILPQTNSTDSWATLINQTPRTGFAVGGVRDQVNTYYDTLLAATTIDGIINGNTDAESGTIPGVWVVNGSGNYATSDGTHPSGTMHALMATRVQTAMATQVP